MFISILALNWAIFIRSGDDPSSSKRDDVECQMQAFPGQEGKAYALINKARGQDVEVNLDKYFAACFYYCSSLLYIFPHVLCFISFLICERKSVWGGEGGWGVKGVKSKSQNEEKGA